VDCGYVHERPDLGDREIKPAPLPASRVAEQDDPAAPERACGTFPVDVAPSTLTHHFRVLREAGVIRQREDGNRRWTALREEELQGRFPGVLDTIMTAYEAGSTAPSSGLPA
jgi:DNA-binding transcriptional ArsR family regulator